MRDGDADVVGPSGSVYGGACVLRRLVPEASGEMEHVVIGSRLSIAVRYTFLPCGLRRKSSGPLPYGSAQWKHFQWTGPLQPKLWPRANGPCISDWMAYFNSYIYVDINSTSHHVFNNS